MDKITIQDFSKLIEQNALKLVAFLHAQIHFSRQDIQNVIKIFVDFYRNMLLKIITSKESTDLKNKIKILDTAFEPFKTDYLTKQYFENMGTFIKPKSIPISAQLGFKLKNGKKIAITKTTDIQVIPIKKVLKRYLEMPGVLKTIEAHINKCLKSNKFDSLFKGTLYQSLEKRENNSLNFPYLVYDDDYEINNCVGSRKVINKIVAVYLELCGLPEEFSSQLQNIFLVQLHKTEDHKTFGNKKIFQNLVKDLIDLEENGICFFEKKSVPNLIFCCG